MTQSRTSATFAPPVMEARRWLDGVQLPHNQNLINVSQAAPVDPPPDALRRAMADFAITEDSAHLYGPVLGNDNLRTALAAQIGQHYAAQVAMQQVAITSGCNQAFAAAISALTSEGDEVILPTPWYFNHKMWLDMAGVNTVDLSTSDDLLPDPDQARALITDKTRAIALVT
ncbi:MAG: aminotransferase class I/II-fold pyridoxal phosphate-dependent enzyme, partial [Pseudomonadota bacterium]